MGSFLAPGHSEEWVMAADGRRYRVRLDRTGVARYLFFGGPFNQLNVMFTWLRHVSRRDKSWTLSIVRRGEWGDKTVTEQQFDSRREAAEWAELLVDSLMTDPEAGKRLEEKGE
jgi:hypothetical protein